MDKLVHNLETVLSHYRDSFSRKKYNIESKEIDLLMKVFNISQKKKFENKQYWGRELGMCWQKVVIEVFKAFDKSYKTALTDERDELCDLISGKDAIDTKYRIGSGDSGTLKKFKAYAPRLIEKNLRPVMLILRNDNLNNAIRSCEKEGWKIYRGESTFQYIQDKTSFDLKKFLLSNSNKFSLY